MSRAFKILGIATDLPRERWLKLRRGTLGASDSASILLHEPWGTPMTVYADKMGAGTEDEDNDYLKWGRVLQPLLLEWLSEEAGVRVIGREMFLLSETNPLFSCTLDGFIESGSEWIPVEAKHTAWKERDWEDGVPAYVMVQIQHQLYVTGAPHGYVVASIAGKPPVWKLVERDENVIADITGEGQSFWQHHVIPGVPPPADGSPRTHAALARLYPGGGGSLVDFEPEIADLLPELIEKQEGAKALQEGIDEMKGMMKRAIGNEEGGRFPNGMVVTWKPNKHGVRSFRGPLGGAP